MNNLKENIKLYVWSIFMGYLWFKGYQFIVVAFAFLYLFTIKQAVEN